MVPFSLLALALTTVGGYANPTARAVSGLDVSLSSPVDKVSSVSELRIIATVKNVGDTDLKIFKSQTVLDNERPTRSFIVRNDGKEAKFIGAMPIILMDNLSEHDWVVIPAGGTVTAEHNVSTVYDFSATGPGTFTFEPISSFQVIGLNGSVGAAPDTVRLDVANARSVSITVTDDVSPLSLFHIKPGGVECDGPDKAAFLLTSFIESKILAFRAISWIDGIPKQKKYADDTRRVIYARYFGSNQTSMRNLKDIGNMDLRWLHLNCNEDPNKWCDSFDIRLQNIVGYSHMATKTIYFCPLFFKQVSASKICGSEDVKWEHMRGITMIDLMAFALIDGARGSKSDCTEYKHTPKELKPLIANSYGCLAATAWADDHDCWE